MVFYKRLLFVFLLAISLDNSALAQSKEFGGGLASFNYTGDLNRQYNFANQTLGGYVNYAKNFQNGWAAKLMLAAGKIKGADQGKTPFSAVRSASFNNFLTEFSFQAQYEFLDFRTSPLIEFSPYIGVGAGFLLMNRADKITDYSDIQLMIPLSVGIKYRLNPLWSIHAEFSARKTFYDYLDNISEEEVTDKRNSNYQFGNWNDTDWYYLISVGLNYTFWQVDCPVPLSK